MITVTKIIGFDKPLEVGKIYENKRITTTSALNVMTLSYKVIREATREEWEADGPKVINNEERVKRGYFYEIEPVD